MASIKTLKRDISYLSNELIMATLFKKADIQSEDIPKMNQILANIADFDTQFRQRAQNNPKQATGKETKAYYKQVLLDMETSITQILKEINEFY